MAEYRQVGADRQGDVRQDTRKDRTRAQRHHAEYQPSEQARDHLRQGLVEVEQAVGRRHRRNRPPADEFEAGSHEESSKEELERDKRRGVQHPPGEHLAQAPIPEGPSLEERIHLLEARLCRREPRPHGNKRKHDREDPHLARECPEPKPVGPKALARVPGVDSGRHDEDGDRRDGPPREVAEFGRRDDPLTRDPSHCDENGPAGQREEHQASCVGCSTPTKDRHSAEHRRECHRYAGKALAPPGPRIEDHEQKCDIAEHDPGEAGNAHRDFQRRRAGEDATEPALVPACGAPHPIDVGHARHPTSMGPAPRATRARRTAPPFVVDIRRVLRSGSGRITRRTPTH